MDSSNIPVPRKRIASNQITGSRGEAFISFLLSNFCLVRPVANGTDVGVDLYCEALIDGVPHSHFWVQVKSSSEKTEIKKKLRIKDLEYWSRQPIPVFIFLVHVNDELSASKFKINIINLTEKLIQTPYVKPSVKYKVYSSDYTILSTKELETFVSNIVPSTIARLPLRDGFLIPVKQNVNETYIKYYKYHGAHAFAQRILKNIGRMSSLLLRDILNNQDSDAQKYRGQLEEILETFEHWGNYDFHFAAGLSKMRDKKYQEAIPLLKKSLKLIEADSRLQKSSTWPIRSLIGTYIDQCSAKL
jgi:hypothetical protein